MSVYTDFNFLVTAIRLNDTNFHTARPPNITLETLQYVFIIGSLRLSRMLAIAIFNFDSETDFL